MELESVIIGIVSLALFIMPILYITVKQKQHKARVSEDFLKAAEGRQLRISQYDSWPSGYGIGIDSAQNKLFYLKKQGTGDKTTLIDLSNVAACRVINLNRDVNGNRVIDFIELRFTFRDPKAPDQVLEFYNREETMSLNEELVLAEKWKELVSSCLQAQPPHVVGGGPKSAPATLA